MIYIIISLLTILIIIMLFINQRMIFKYLKNNQIEQKNNEDLIIKFSDIFNEKMILANQEINNLINNQNIENQKNNQDILFLLKSILEQKPVNQDYSKIINELSLLNQNNNIEILKYLKEIVDKKNVETEHIENINEEENLNQNQVIDNHVNIIENHVSENIENIIENQIIEGETNTNEISLFEFDFENNIETETEEIVLENTQNLNSKTEITLVMINLKTDQRIPNAQVNKEYNIKFDLINETFIKITGFENTGLIFNNQTLTLSGQPIIAGDFTLKIVTNKLEKEFILTINPDPKMLWRNIPSSQDMIYAKADSDSKIIFDNEKCLVVASQRGRSHSHEGKPRDDHFEIEIFNNWYIIALADGAGSAKYSRKGSEITCLKSVEIIKSFLENDANFLNIIKDYNLDKSEKKLKNINLQLYNLFGNAAIKSFNELLEEAKNNNALIKDYATTILLSICKKVDNQYFVASFWIGDGAIGLYTQNESIKLMGDVDSGEFAGQTRFLTMQEMLEAKEIYSRLRFEIIQNFTALVLMTDGVSDAKFETDNNLNNSKKWDNLWNELNLETNLELKNEASKAKLLNWLDFWSAGNHDDRTIAILY